MSRKGKDQSCLLLMAKQQKHILKQKCASEFQSQISYQKEKQVNSTLESSFSRLNFKMNPKKLTKTTKLTVNKTRMLMENKIKEGQMMISRKIIRSKINKIFLRMVRKRNH